MQAFLTYAKLVFKKIIFIDDKKKHIESGEKVVRSLGIPFVGIEYTAVKDAKVEPLNKARADFQFDVLEKACIRNRQLKRGTSFNFPITS